MQVWVPNGRRARALNDRDNLLDIREASALLKVSETSLRRWTNVGLLPCLRVGGRNERRFRRSDLLAFAVADGGPRQTTSGTDVSVPSHLCCFYDTDDMRVERAADFLLAGIGPDRGALLLAAADVCGAVLARLERLAPAVHDGIAAGRFVIGPYAATVSEQIASCERTIISVMEAGALAVRAVGDAPAAAWSTTPEKQLAYEREFERRLARRYPIATLCLYDARRISGLEAMAQLRIHVDSARYPGGLA